MSGVPTVCQGSESFLKIGPIAKATAGSEAPITTSAPPACAVPVMNRRRVTVSPSKAPGIPRSAVYLDLLGGRFDANDAPSEPGGGEQYRHAMARGASSASSAARALWSPARASALAAR